MKLYADYLRERQGAEYLETEAGFVTYKIHGQECMVLDIYVLPSMRKSHHGSKLIEKVSKLAKDQGCTLLSATICPAAKGSTEAMMASLHNGFKIHSSGVNCIIITKELG